MSEIDSFYIKAINAMNSRDHMHGKPALQTMLEELSASKSGEECNLTSLVQNMMKYSGFEMMAEGMAMEEEAKGPSTSDQELDLDMLLKEDLACVICQGMDVGARNRLLECTDCHSLYHQECHQPTVSQQDADGSWICASCKEGKRAKKSPTYSSASSSSGSHSSSKPKSSSNSPRHSSERPSTSSSTYKSSSSKSSASSSKSLGSISKASTSGSSKSASSSSSSSKHSSGTTASNIISADKRIQNMKKKAAKLHEKKKSSR